jgi:hypothetical protein
VTCTFTNTQDEEDTGSISITKVEVCEECEALTIGYWFNAAGSHDEETDALLAAGIVADGIEFNSADEVREYRADDISGESDGQPGLSARGLLTLQYLATQLNVLLNGEDCDLAARVYNNPDSPFDGWTVQMILDEADLAFDGESDYTDQAIQEALNDINNSAHVEENPLTCAEGDGGAVLEGAKFDVYFDTDESGDFDPAEDTKVGELTSGADGTASIGGLAFGTYFLVETAAPEGCDLLTEPIEVTLTENAPDADITIENDCEGGGGEGDKGSITIIKNAIPDAAQDFLFTTTGEGLPISFSLDDDTDPTLPNIITFEELDPGTYSVTEVRPGTWTVTSVICTEGGTGNAGDRVANITLVAGANVTCTFVNTQDSVQGPLGSITILKNAIPDDAQDFGFTATGAGMSSFSLDDDADATLSNQQTFSGLAAGSYSVTETAVAGWTLTSVTCSAGGTVNAATANITLAAGANVTCTFVNTKQGAGTAGSTSPQGTQGSTGVPNTSTFGDELLGGNTLGILVAMGTIGGLMALATAGLLSANAARQRRRR